MFVNPDSLFLATCNDPVLHDVASADTFLPEYPVSGEREPDTINFPVALVRFLPDGVTQGFVIVGVLLGYGVF